MKIKKVILSLACCLPLTVAAESISLLDAYQKAQSYDATLRAAKADNRAMSEEISKSLAAFLPQVRLSMYEGRGVTDSVTPGLFRATKNHTVYDSRNYSLSVRQSIFNKANFADYNQSKAEAAKSDAMLEKEQNSLIIRVSGAYLDLLLATDNVSYSAAQKPVLSLSWSRLSVATRLEWELSLK